jgi:hypothetical protein
LIRPLRRILPVLFVAALAAPLPALAQGGLPDTLGRIKAAGQSTSRTARLDPVLAGRRRTARRLLDRAVPGRHYRIARAVGIAELKVNWIRHGQRAARGVKSGRAHLDCARTRPRRLSHAGDVDFSNLVFIDSGGLLVRSDGPIQSVDMLKGESRSGSAARRPSSAWRNGPRPRSRHDDRHPFATAPRAR